MKHSIYTRVRFIADHNECIYSMFLVGIVTSHDSEERSEGEVLSAGAAAGIAVTVTLLLSLPVGVVIGLGVAWYGKRRGRGPSTHSEGDQHKSQQVQEAIYEESPETAIPLSDNQAYGHIDMQRKN